MTKLTSANAIAMSMRGICKLLLLSLCLSPVALHAQQAPESLVWTFNATISGKTCDVESPPAVNLPTIGVGALPAVDTTAGSVRVALKIKNCDPSITKARFVFIARPDSFKPQYFKIDETPTAASGIAFRLTDDANQLIRADGTDNTADTLVSNSQGELGITVTYVRTNSVMKPGDANGHIEFDVDYP
jgi:type 1 fimbria pilin